MKRTNRHAIFADRRYFKVVILLVFLFGLRFSINAQELYYPDKDWERKDAKSVGINKKKLNEAVDYAKQN